jgi:two-component system OmpR family response regulator
LAQRILVVEDDPISRQVLRDFLRAKGYDVIVAGDGREALDRFAADRPALVLLDVALPHKNGFEVCWEIKRTAVGRETPVLLMSAVHTDTAHAGPHADGLGAAGYLVKPFSLARMLERVEALIGPAG